MIYTAADRTDAHRAIWAGLAGKTLTDDQARRLHALADAVPVGTVVKPWGVRPLEGVPTAAEMSGNLLLASIDAREGLG